MELSWFLWRKKIIQAPQQGTNKQLHSHMPISSEMEPRSHWQVWAGLHQYTTHASWWWQGSLLQTLSSLTNDNRTSLILSSKGSSQFLLHSQWLSKNVSTSPFAMSAPLTLERIKPKYENIIWRLRRLG